MRQLCGYFGSRHPQRQCPGYRKICAGCQKIGQFKAECKSRKAREVKEIEQVENQDEAEEDIDMVRIDLIQFNKNHSVLTANLKAAAGHNKTVVAHKIDTGSDGNILPSHVCKKLFPNITKEQLAETRIKEKH